MDFRMLSSFFEKKKEEQKITVTLQNTNAIMVSNTHFIPHQAPLTGSVHTGKMFDRSLKRSPKRGDIVTVNFQKLHPVGGFCVDPLFDTKGVQTFVLGFGNYLPGIHELIENMESMSVKDQFVNAGWGEPNKDLIAKIPKRKLNSILAKKESFNESESELTVGNTLILKKNISCVIKDIDVDFITLDANPPLAGASYSCSLELLAIAESPSEFFHSTTEEEGTTKEGAHQGLYDIADRLPSSRYQVATFALGDCFWGAELKYMREPGVVGTKVGFTQGTTKNPSYNEVCAGDTGHVEAVMIVFDSIVVSFERLLIVAFDRLNDDIYLQSQERGPMDTAEFLLDPSKAQKPSQYRHGIYYHNDEQKSISMQMVKRLGQGKSKIEMKQAKQFYEAESYHQQYLMKRGQSASKRAKQHIRCHG